MVWIKVAVILTVTINNDQKVYEKCVKVLQKSKTFILSGALLGALDVVNRGIVRKFVPYQKRAVHDK